MGLFGRDDRTTPQPATPQPAASRPAAKPQAQPRSGEATFVGQGSRFEGRLVADNDVEVTGELSGTVEGKGQVLVLEGSKVEAVVHARVVVVAGQLVGDVSADEKIELRPSATLQGNITAPRIVIQDGATFEGQVFMQKPERKTTPAAAATSTQPPAAVEATKPAVEPGQPARGGDSARNHRDRR